MAEVYVFDLDGTLADSMSVGVEIVLRFLDEQGIAYPDDIVDTLMPLGYRGISEYYANELGVPLAPQEIYDCFERRLKKAYAEDILLKEGAKETLFALKARGARLNVLTASPHIFTDACLKNGGVYDLFENVWSAEDFGLLKSDKEIYIRVASALKVNVSDFCMVDDNVFVLQTAKSVGVKTIGVNDRYSDEATVRAAADRYVYSLRELIE